MLLKNQTIGPLDAKQLEQVSQAIQGFSPEQKIWLSGYLAGQSLSLPSTAAPPKAQEKLTVLYGSQTGNAKNLAQTYANQATAAGINAQLVSLADYKPRQIAKEKHMVLLISTHGEGDAPDDAEIFHEYIFSDKAPDLKQLKYSVLALGDSSYEQFCQTGLELDQQLSKLGATAIVDRVDCDLDYEDDAQQWQDSSLNIFKETLINEDSAPITPLSLLKNETTAAYNRNNTYAAEVLTVQKITTEQSVKNVHHIELSLEDANINYKPGDSLGVVASNDPQSVRALIDTIQADYDQSVEYKGESYQLEQLLTSQLEITLLNKKFLTFYAQHAQATELQDTLSQQKSFNAYIEKRQIIDVLNEYPSNLSAQQLIDNLLKITPRLYSIASSQSVNEDEVHLTISLVESSYDQPNKGLVSGLLCSRSQAGDMINVYVEENNNFKLPEDTNTDVIMIGAGTGIAPYRAFLQERQEQQASGQNWLFFGNPSCENDFLYQLELQKFHAQSVLNRIDLAFSRDQAEKIYVQHRVEQQGTDLWQWLEKGAHLYICGNADYMAKDVEQSLIKVITQHGSMDAEQAKEYLKQLKRSNRYQKDIY